MECLCNLQCNLLNEGLMLEDPRLFAVVVVAVDQHLQSMVRCDVAETVPDSHKVLINQKHMKQLRACLQDHHLLALPKAQNLCSLDLSHCASLTGNCLIYIKSMTALTSLDLSHCR